MDKKERDKIQARERRKFRKENGICTNCGKEWAMDGLTMCPECSFNDSIKQRKRRSQFTREQLDKVNEYQRNKRKQRATTGFCTTCGNKLKQDVYKTCYECRLRDRRRHKLKYHAKGYEELGLCRWCGKETEEGTKYCKEHLSYMRKLCEKNFRPNGVNIANNSYFRSLNNEDFKKAKTTEVERTG